MDYLKVIDNDLARKVSHTQIVRKLFLTYPTFALIGDEERQFDIFNEISEYFKIPIQNIQIVGSAKLGKSVYKVSHFTNGKSDLDVAIIDPTLFLYYSELVFKQTKGFKNRTDFSKFDGSSTYNQYIDYISKGIFRPDLMPKGEKRASWIKFFGQLSNNHREKFKSINAGIYMSQTYFEEKQCSVIRNHIEILKKPI